VNVSMQKRRAEDYRNPEDRRKSSAKRRKLAMRFRFVRFSGGREAHALGIREHLGDATAT